MSPNKTQSKLRGTFSHLDRMYQDLASLGNAVQYMNQPTIQLAQSIAKASQPAIKLHTAMQKMMSPSLLSMQSSVALAQSIANTMPYFNLGNAMLKTAYPSQKWNDMLAFHAPQSLVAHSNYIEQIGHTLNTFAANMEFATTPMIDSPLIDMFHLPFSNEFHETVQSIAQLGAPIVAYMGSTKYVKQIMDMEETALPFREWFSALEYSYATSTRIMKSGGYPVGSPTWNADDEARSRQQYRSDFLNVLAHLRDGIFFDWLMRTYYLTKAEVSVIFDNMTNLAKGRINDIKGELLKDSYVAAAFTVSVIETIIVLRSGEFDADELISNLWKEEFLIPVIAYWIRIFMNKTNDANEEQDNQ